VDKLHSPSTLSPQPQPLQQQQQPKKTGSDLSGYLGADGTGVDDDEAGQDGPGLVPHFYPVPTATPLPEREHGPPLMAIYGSAQTQQAALKSGQAKLPPPPAADAAGAAATADATPSLPMAAGGRPPARGASEEAPSVGTWRSAIELVAAQQQQIAVMQNELTRLRMLVETGVLPVQQPPQPSRAPPLQGAASLATPGDSPVAPASSSAATREPAAPQAASEVAGRSTPPAPAQAQAELEAARRQQDAGARADAQEEEEDQADSAPVVPAGAVTEEEEQQQQKQQKQQQIKQQATEPEPREPPTAVDGVSGGVFAVSSAGAEATPSTPASGPSSRARSAGGKRPALTLHSPATSGSSGEAPLAAFGSGGGSGAELYSEMDTSYGIPRILHSPLVVPRQSPSGARQARPVTRGLPSEDEAWLEEVERKYLRQLALSKGVGTPSG
jgi:hypothetical protein